MKYGEARYENQMFGEGGTGSGDAPLEQHDMIDPEGLTPGYEGYESKVQRTDAMVESTPVEEIRVEYGPSAAALEQMNTLLEQKIEATLAGDTEKAAQLEKMITMHAQRNGISYEAPESVE